MVKRKVAKKRTVNTKRKATRKHYNVSQIKEDTKQRRKYHRGGRIEAYTFGEVL